MRWKIFHQVKLIYNSRNEAINILTEYASAFSVCAHTINVCKVRHDEPCGRSYMTSLYEICLFQTCPLKNEGILTN
jgi:hypothetical protein